jgi:predicted regulator of Ras-like GTPase activity (Roadblock/LC7/MglB family)
MLASMDAAQAIADLTEISPQVKAVVVIASDGSVAGSNLPADGAAQRLADQAKALLDAAERLRPGVAQLEAATTEGSVFAVRDGDRAIAATTSPEPTVGLVFYDLKTCLRSVDEPPAAGAEPEPTPEPPARAKRAPVRKKKEADDAAA